MPPPGSRHCPSGFTLVELLVVMAIMAVLAALAIPALNSMRSKADAAHCSSNLRQMIMATQSWTSENGGRFPALVNHPWDEKGHIEDLSTFPLSFPPLVPFGVALAPYLGFDPVDTSLPMAPALIPAILRCPASSHNGAQMKQFPWISMWPTYRYNSYAASRIPAAAKNLSKAMLFIDAVWPSWSDDDCLSHQSPAGINVGYADGHVDFLPATRYRELNPTSDRDYQSDLYRNGWFLD